MLQDKNKFPLFLSLAVFFVFVFVFVLDCIFCFCLCFCPWLYFLSLSLFLFLSFWWRGLLAGQVLGGQEIIHDGAAILSGKMWPQTSAILSTRHQLHQSCKSDLFHTHIICVNKHYKIWHFGPQSCLARPGRRRPQSCPPATFSPELQIWSLFLSLFLYLFLSLVCILLIADVCNLVLPPPFEAFHQSCKSDLLADIFDNLCEHYKIWHLNRGRPQSCPVATLPPFTPFPGPSTLRRFPRVANRISSQIYLLICINIIKFDILTHRRLQSCPAGTLKSFARVADEKSNSWKYMCKKIVNGKKFRHFNAGGKVGFMVCFGQNMWHFETQTSGPEKKQKNILPNHPS